jgi:hypothetical protein
LNLKHTITEGSIKGEHKNCKVPFALVFVENGVYFLETFLPEDFFEESDFSNSFQFFGVTEKDFEIEITGLTYTRIEHQNNKATFVCRDYLKLIERENNFPKKSSEDYVDAIHFLELEGFNTKFGDHTEIKRHRQYHDDNNSDISFDHTKCALFIQIDGYKENYFQLIFSESQSENRVLIDFTKTGGFGRLTFDHYKVFKKQLIGFLSLINGGNVFIKKELTGTHYRLDGSHSQIEYHYSSVKFTNSNTSDYIPINEHHSYSSSIFRNAFLNCFDSYFHYEKTLQLNSIVASINSANSTSGIRQSYSILINALEKLSTNYQNSKQGFDENIIDIESWENTVRSALFETLNAQKPLINSNNKMAFLIFKSRLFELNRRKNSTSEKMYELLDFGCIPINENVENLVNIERNSAVHTGEFGVGMNEMFVNYQKLDHILRDIILNIIDYRNERKSTSEYATLEDRKLAYPKRNKKTPTYYCSQPIRD